MKKESTNWIPLRINYTQVTQTALRNIKSELIKSISESIKTSVLYNACPGAKNETKVITLRLVAQ